MKKRLVLAVLASAAYASTAGAHTLYPQDADGVFIRQGPGTSYPVIGSLRLPTGVPVVGKEYNWYRVRLKDGQEGYVAGWVARVVYDDEEQLAVVQTDVLNVRARPDTGSAVLGQVRRGEQFRLREIQGDWWLIDFQGKQGWVSGLYMGETAAPARPPAAPSPARPPAAATTTAKGAALTVATADVLTGRNPVYDTLDTVRSGESLTYLDAAEGWVRVQTPRGSRGWLPGPQVALWDSQVEWARGALYRLDEGFWQVAFAQLRTVTPAEGLRLRREPDLNAATLATLPAGTSVKVLQTRGSWLQVTLADGRSGWVAGEYTRAAAAPAAPKLQSATLRVTAPGVVQLELLGRLEGAVAQTGRSDGDLFIALPDPAGRTAGLKVADHGVAELAVAAEGVHLRFTDRPDIRVVEQTAGRIRLELRPALQSVQLRSENGQAIYRLGVSGQVQPVTALAAGGREVVVTLPGTRLLAPDLPPYVQAEEQNGSLRLRIPSVRPFALKRVEGGFDAVFYPGGLAGKVIMLDAGHGGGEPGARTADGELLEKEVNLDVVLKLSKLLQDQGARVVLTRSSDERALPRERWERVPSDERVRADLDWRASMANEQRVDLFLSVHSNAGPPGMSGTETFYSSDNLNAGRSRDLAGAVQTELIRTLGRTDRRAKDSLFYVVKFTEAPAALAELAFLSDPEEARLLGTAAFRQKAAEAMTRGLAQYFRERS